MTPQGLYIEPQFQLPQRALSRCAPDIQDLIAGLSKGWDAFCNTMGAIANAFIEAFKPTYNLIRHTVGSIFDALRFKPRSKLRLPRHRTQHERRIAWKLAHPFMPMKINGRLRKLVTV